MKRVIANSTLTSAELTDLFQVRVLLGSFKKIVRVSDKLVDGERRESDLLALFVYRLSHNDFRLVRPGVKLSQKNSQSLWLTTPEKLPTRSLSVPARNALRD